MNHKGHEAVHQTTTHTKNTKPTAPTSQLLDHQGHRLAQKNTEPKGPHHQKSNRPAYISLHPINPVPLSLDPTPAM